MVLNLLEFNMVTVTKVEEEKERNPNQRTV